MLASVMHPVVPSVQFYLTGKSESVGMMVM